LSNTSGLSVGRGVHKTPSPVGTSYVLYINLYGANQHDIYFVLEIIDFDYIIIKKLIS